MVTSECFVGCFRESALLGVSERRRHTQEPADEGHGSAQITGTIVILLAFREGMGGGGGQQQADKE